MNEKITLVLSSECWRNNFQLLEKFSGRQEALCFLWLHSWKEFSKLLPPKSGRYCRLNVRLNLLLSFTGVYANLWVNVYCDDSLLSWVGECSSVWGILRHDWSRSPCTQVQPVTCWHLSVFLYWIGVYSINSSKMISKFLEVLNFNRLILKLNLFICD